MEKRSGLAPDKTWIANKRLDCFGMRSVGWRVGELENGGVRGPILFLLSHSPLTKSWVDRRDLHPLRDLHRVECYDYTTANMRKMAMRGRIELPSSDRQSGIMAII